MKKIFCTFNGIEIIGDSRYVKQIRQALSLLKRKAPRQFSTVRRYIGRIEDYQRSGMAPWEHPPTFYLGRVSAFYSITWCASCIVHDAHHAKLYADNAKGDKPPKPALYSGEKVERACIHRQIAVSRKIGAPEIELRHLRAQHGQHIRIKKQWW